MADTIEDLLIATYKPLFEAERVRRDQIRASLTVPMTALSIAMVGFGVLLNNFEWRDGTSLGVWLSMMTIVAALVAVGCLGRALMQLIRADRPEIRADPSKLVDRRTFVMERSRELEAQGDEKPEGIVLRELKETIAEDYAACYADMMGVNAKLLNLRDSALRWLAVALLALVATFIGTGLDNNENVIAPLFERSTRPVPVQINGEPGIL